MSADTPIMDPDRRLRCIIIGAGASAVKLRTAFGDGVDFTIYEKNSDLGGTWLENRYPGCACDVPSHIYQFSFLPNPYWSSFYASSAEIQAYLRAVVIHYRLERFIHFNSRVEHATWHEESATWTIRVEGKGEFESEILINASGILNNPKFPSIKSLDNFGGTLAHTAAWDPDMDVTGKCVAIVGASASAIQVLPTLQAQASHIDIYIRTPSWITPPAGANFNKEHNHIYTAQEKARFSVDPDYSLRMRKDMEATFNSMYRAFFKDSEPQRAMQAKLKAHMKDLIESEELQDKLIPSFEAGCRRLNPGERYLHALQRDNVEAVFDAIQEVTRSGIRDVLGRERAADVLVTATGFDTSFRPRFSIVGANGVDLRDLWKDDPISYFGLAVAKFPNYLIFLGPNTPISNGSLIGALEATGDYFVRLIRKMMTQRVASFRVRPIVQADFNDHTQRFMQRMVWTGTCRSWFKTEKGKVTAIWPGSGLHYREVLQSDRWEDFEWKYKGNQFGYWCEGYSQVEQEANPDLSWYIQLHDQLPYETLQQAQDNPNPNRKTEEQDASATRSDDLRSLEAPQEVVRITDNPEQDNSSQDAAVSHTLVSSQSDIEFDSNKHWSSHSTLVLQATAFSV